LNLGAVGAVQNLPGCSVTHRNYRPGAVGAVGAPLFLNNNMKHGKRKTLTRDIKKHCTHCTHCTQYIIIINNYNNINILRVSIFLKNGGIHLFLGAARSIWVQQNTIFINSWTIITGKKNISPIKRHEIWDSLTPLNN